MHYFSNFETKFFKLFINCSILFQVSIIDYVFLNLYFFKVSSKSTVSLLFWGLNEYRFIL